MFIERTIIKLSSVQEKMINSGWGSDVIEKSTVEKIIYLSDGLKVHGYLAYPKDLSKKYPCIIWCRGGFSNAGNINEFNATGIFGQLASWGYVVFSTQYRGNTGSEGHDEFGGSDVNDILNLIQLSEGLEFADNTNWGIEGWSRGGMMAYLASTRTNIFRAAVIVGGISDLNEEFRNNKFIQKLFKLSEGKNIPELMDDEIKKRSIIYQVDKISNQTNFLIMHGINDHRVPVNQALSIAEKLIENKLKVKLVLFENGDHFLKEHRKEVADLKKNWFDKFLKQESK